MSDTESSLTYDLFLVETKQKAQDGARSCIESGYDGLASIATPEAYSYARKFTYDFWKNQGGIYIGLVFLPGDVPRWEDGSLPASDAPWGWDDPPASTDQPLYARITRVGKLRLFDGIAPRVALCGNYNRSKTTEIEGRSATGYQLGGQRSVLAEAGMTSYLRCVTLCARQKECRAATLSSDPATCKTFGPGNNSDLVLASEAKTFLRVGFV
ncbi:hypothetical protein EGW08_018608 [Elysia chlorotica]|uniref:Uncharacterized protein n=1 Tax=Elysia chlorotica TaxID=188477 RepID=A0A3S1B2S2_ELYCH|nr:hypothetical protein EGW08_018608 [Elysia chlorotica]